MKLAEKHKRFVVERFAQFKLLHIIVDEFMGEFEDELDEIFDEPYSPIGKLGETIDRRAKLSALFRSQAMYAGGYWNTTSIARHATLEVLRWGVGFS